MASGYTSRIHYADVDQKRVEQVLSELGSDAWSVVKHTSRYWILQHLETEWYFKLEYRKGFIWWLKNLLRGSMAKRMHLGTQVILSVNGWAPRVIASGKNEKGESFSLMEPAHGVGFKDLATSLFVEPPEGVTSEWQCQLYRELGQFLATLHKRGVVHGDIAPNNIIMNVEDGEIVPRLIDNERSRYSTRDRDCLRNIIQLITMPEPMISLSARKAFLEGYYQVHPLNGSLEAFSSAVETKLEARLARGNKLQLADQLGDQALPFIGCSIRSLPEQGQ